MNIDNHFSSMMYLFRAGGFEFASDTAFEGAGYAAIRPEDILVSKESPPGDAHNRFKATIEQIVNKGSVIYVKANLPPEMVCLVTRHQFQELGLETGREVFLTFPASAVHLFRD